MKKCHLLVLIILVMVAIGAPGCIPATRGFVRTANEAQDLSTNQKIAGLEGKVARNIGVVKSELDQQYEALKGEVGDIDGRLTTVEKDLKGLQEKVGKVRKEAHSADHRAQRAQKSAGEGRIQHRYGGTRAFSVYGFPSGKTVLTPNMEKWLKEEFVPELKDKQLELKALVGMSDKRKFPDKVKSDELNAELAGKRAEKVKTALEALGVDVSAVKIAVESATDEMGPYVQNRSVVIVVGPQPQTP